MDKLMSVRQTFCGSCPPDTSTKLWYADPSSKKRGFHLRMDLVYRTKPENPEEGEVKVGVPVDLQAPNKKNEKAKESQ